MEGTGIVFVTNEAVYIFTRIMWQYSNMSSSFDYVKCEASATFLTSRCESIILGKEGQCKDVELRYQ